MNSETQLPNVDYLTKATFGEGKDKDQQLERLQGEIDAIRAKTVAAGYEPFRDGAENLLRVIRVVFGQVARFAEGNFRENASFYLGQLHALAEMAETVRRRRLPKE